MGLMCGEITIGRGSNSTRSTMSWRVEMKWKLVIKRRSETLEVIMNEVC